MTDSEIIGRLYELDNYSENDPDWVHECTIIVNVMKEKEFTNKSLIRSIIESLESDKIKKYLKENIRLFSKNNITI